MVSIGEASKILKISISTLRRWEKQGLISPERTPGGTRKYDLEKLKELKSLGRKPLRANKLSKYIQNQSSNFSSIKEPVEEMTGLNPLSDDLDKPDIAGDLQTNALRDDWLTAKKTVHLSEKVKTESSSLIKNNIRLSDIGARNLSKYVFLPIIIPVIGLGLLFFAYKDQGVDGLVAAIKAQKTPLTKTEEIKDGEVLAETTESSEESLMINIPSYFNEDLIVRKRLVLGGGIQSDEEIVVNDDLSVAGVLTASNIIYGLTAGSGISVGTGQRPTITNSGVLSLGGKTGTLTLEAGSGITVDGLKVTNKANAYKSIKLGSDTASAGSIEDTFEFASGTGISLSLNTSDKKLTITSTAASLTGWTAGSSVVYLTTTSDRVGIGTTSPDSTAVLDLTSTTRGFLPPRMTTAQRDAITSPATGLLIFNTTTAQHQTYNGTEWGSISGAATKWNEIANPDGNLSLTMAGYTSTFTYGATTGAGTNLFSLTDTTNNTGTGYLMSLSTASGSSLKPFRVNAVGTDVFTIDATGTSTFSKVPTSSAVGTGTIYINPASATADYTLFGVAVGGTEKLRIDAEGDIHISGSIISATPGTVGYWSRASTTTYLANSGDNVGIGTTSASALLDLQQAGTATALTDMFEITNSGNAASMTDTRSGILFNQFYYDATTPAVADSGRILMGTEGNWTSTASTQDSYMAFQAALNGTPTEYMRITSGGNVGIGTTNPAGRLDLTDTSNTAASFTLTNNTITTLGAGINTTGMVDISSTSLTTGNLVNLETTTTLTSGRLLNITSTSTALTTGNLVRLDWSPASSTTATGDLFSLNIGTNGSTTGNLFNILDSSSSIFSVSETSVTTSLPAQFNAAGDVSMAYDLNFINPTASFIKSSAPLYLQSGATFDSSNLTLKTYNQGTIVFDTATTTGTALDLTNTTLTTGTGFNLSIGTTQTTGTALNVVSTGTITSGGYLANFTANTLTTGTNVNITSNALTSGDALAISSSSTAMTGNLLDITLSGSNAANTGSVGRITNSGTSNANTAFMVTNLGGASSTSFRVNDETGDADTSPFIIDASGNVGIGTTNPSQKLVVNATNPVIRAQSSADNWATIDMTDGTQTWGLSARFDDTAGSDANRLEIQYGGISQVAIDASGNMGIGIANPGGKLDVTDTSNTASTLSLTNNTITTLGAGINTAGMIDISSTSLTTGNLVNLETTTSLTSGRVLNITSTSTALTSGNLISLDWSPGSATTATGDLFSLNIGTNGSTTGNLFNILDTSSSIFSISESAVTTSLPAQFNAPGDVAIAYDLVFNNPTASFIKSIAPVSIESGETFNSSNLTLKTYNNGRIVFDTATTTGYGIDITNTTLTSGRLVNIAPTFAGSAVTGYALYNAGTDSTANANTDYGYYGSLALSGNAAKTGVGIYQTITSSSTTADTLYALDLATDVTGIMTTGTRNIYGLRSQPSAGAESTGGTTNVYGGYFKTTADVAAGGTINGYGLYVANGVFDTDGTSTQYGLYVESPTGADTNYAAIFAGGNVGIGTTAPGQRFVIKAASANGDVARIIAAADADALFNFIDNGAAGNAILDLYYNAESGTNTLGTRISADSAFPTYFNNGNVGIGTTAPVEKLRVTDSTASGNNILIVEGSNATYYGGFRNLLAGSDGDRMGIILGDGTAALHRVFVDNSGNLRILSAADPSDGSTSGTVVGTQTSIRDTKQDIQIYSDYEDALSKIVNAPLATFRYKNEVAGYGSNSPMAKTRLGYIADEVDPMFMWGNAIDQVSVNGLLMGSVKSLDSKIKQLSSDVGSIRDITSFDSHPELVSGSSNLMGSSLSITKMLNQVQHDSTKTNTQVLGIEEKIASLSARLVGLESRIKSFDVAQDKNQESSESAKVASSSAQLAEQESTEEASSSSRLANTLEDPQDLLPLEQYYSSTEGRGLDPSGEVSSDVLGLNQYLEATPSSTLLESKTLTLDTLKTIDATISGVFKALGESFLGNTIIAGSLAIDGTMSLADDGISAIGTLYIQKNPLAEAVDFFNGKVKIDKNGTVTLNKLAVNDSDSENKALGSGIIKSGSTSIKLLTKSVTDKSRIFITPTSLTGKQALIVTGKETGVGFTVEIEEVYSKDITFDWLIVDGTSEISDSITAEQDTPQGVIARSEATKQSIQDTNATASPLAPSSRNDATNTLTINSPDLGYLRVRSAPSSLADEVVTVADGETFPYYATSDGWYLIEYKEGFSGWVKGTYVTL